MKYNNFSVSMCVYEKDNPVWFKDAVESILNQTVKPTEVVLVVDGPVTNELNDIINELENNNIFKIIRFKENQGHGNARRVGLEACTNNLVALMDADDLCVSDRFEQQLNIFSKYNVDIVGGNISEFIDNINEPVSLRIVPESDETIKNYLKYRCPFNQVTVMFRKDLVQKAGGYIDWYCDEDYYLWLRMFLNNCKMRNTGTILVNVRVGREMYQRRGGLKYFKSEAKLQKFMLDNKIINFDTFLINVLKRLIVQVILPGKIRGWVFQKFARKRV